MSLFLQRSLVLLTFCAFFIGSVSAQAPVSDEEKLGYIIGYDLGSSLKTRGDPVDLEQLVEALKAAYAGEESLLTTEEVTAFRTEYIQKKQAAANAEKAALVAENSAEGAAFLADNRRKAGVVETQSGLQYQVITTGTGPKPSATDSVTVHYTGSLLDGTVFDSSVERGQPASFGLNGVIPGWTEGLQLMSPGGKYKFYIPYDLAYGENGRPPQIPPAAMLIFEVELLSIAGVE